MQRSNIFLKVVLDHRESERPDRLAEEICRRIERLYGVRAAEISNIVTDQAPEEEE